MSPAQGNSSSAQAPDLLSGQIDMYDQQRQSSTTNYVSMEMGGVPPVVNKDGDDDDDVSLAPSIVSSVMTADGIHDETGFLVVCMVILIGDMSRGIFFPTLWPLVSSLGGSTITLGYSVAAFSGGRIIMSPIFGSLSISMGYTQTLLTSVSILLLGTLVYAQVQNVGSPAFLIVAQVLLGIGSGTLGVTRAFVADITAKRNRTTYMAWITAVQYAGFTVTPFIGAVLTKIFGDYEFKAGIFRLNMYTAPAYVMTCVCGGTLLCMTRFFQDRHRVAVQKPKKASKKRELIEEVANSSALWGLLTVYDACILGCMLLNIATKGSIASFETLGIAYAETHFDMLSQQAGSLVATCGTIGVFALLSMGKLSKIFSDIQLICGGMIIMALGIVSLTGVKEGVENASWRYFLAIFMIYAIGYPIGHTAVIGMFSKIVGRRPQGVLLGWFASAGSLARMTFPIMAGYIANFEDVIVLFFILTGVLIAATIFVLFKKSTLIMLSS